MSLSLPYQSIVFVPLDVLTAEELNEMVQNTNFISDQFPINSQNINIASTEKNVIDLGSRKLMWGEYTQTWAAGTSYNIQITMPEDMLNADYSVLVTPYGVGSSINNIESFNFAVKDGSRTTATFEVGVYNAVQQTVSTLGFKWLAIG